MSTKIREQQVNQSILLTYAYVTGWLSGKGEVRTEDVQKATRDGAGRFSAVLANRSFVADQAYEMILEDLANASPDNKVKLVR